ncbi:MAG: response regulator transcription factor [Chloroflexota bacterium]|nr:response regulator transcription factor [Chloroflexota bacterium]
MSATADPTRGETILVVDDEPIVVEVVQRYLGREGFRVLTAANSDQAWAGATSRERPPAVIILDVMLPGIGGVALCRRLREEVGATMPIILLTARGEEADRIGGLGAGADDYVVKPFSPAELVARVKAQLRRVQLDTQAPPAPDDGCLRGGDVVLDAAERTCAVRGVPVALTPKEFDLLHHLMAAPGQVFSRDQLLDAVWDAGFFGFPGTVTVHVRRLREKIERDAERPSHVKTVWGLGYKFAPPSN